MDVINRLRTRIMIAIIAVLFSVLAFILIILNFSLARFEYVKARNFLELIADNDGHLPRPMELKEGGYHVSPMNKGDYPNFEAENPMPFEIHFDSKNFRNYFSVVIGENGVVQKVIRDFPINYSMLEIEKLVSEILATGNKTGIYRESMFYLHEYQGAARLVCILNMNGELDVIHRLFLYSGAILLISIAVAFLCSWFFSGKIVMPVQEAFERQKRFVADAGHELKTPIAVIGANVDVLSSEIGENRWLTYIKDGNDRMSRLVKDLLYLARDDAERVIMHIEDFDFTASVNAAALPFESVIFEDGKKLETDIQTGMLCTGDRQQIEQVVSILVDNAIKNSEKDAVIRVSAYLDRDRHVVKVWNSGRGISRDDLEKIFLRFYRSDYSRARQTGGYGLGLSIAQSIVKNHHGTISVDSKEGEWAEFTVTLP